MGEANGNKEDSVLVKIEEDEYRKPSVTKLLSDLIFSISFYFYSRAAPFWFRKQSQNTSGCITQKETGVHLDGVKMIKNYFVTDLTKMKKQPLTRVTRWQEN